MVSYCAFLGWRPARGFPLLSLLYVSRHVDEEHRKEKQYQPSKIVPLRPAWSRVPRNIADSVQRSIAAEDGFTSSDEHWSARLTWDQQVSVEATPTSLLDLKHISNASVWWLKERSQMARVLHIPHWTAKTLFARSTLSGPRPFSNTVCRTMSQNHPPSENIARLASRIPKGTWDTHMHVVDPRAFPLSKDAQYQPSPHTLDDAHAFLDQLGIQKMVIVQPSIYGNDNACTIDGLRRLGSKNGRAVIQFDPESTSREQLLEWHDLGVRGVRLNFKSVGGEVEQGSLTASMRRYADAVRELGWVLELYTALEDVPLLENAMAEELGVKVCVDHFGHPSSEALEKAKKAQDLPGFGSLVRLLERGQTWVKVSASYRLNKDPRHPVIESLCREILKTRPDRCVFATDWPHTRFDGLDVVPYLDAVLDAIEAEGIPLQQILVSNSQALFDAEAR
ncbi:hypothetical protein LTR74_003160 [Friedmanniomyces endolithicus]|nr:hypothetical protein LTR74_003160 [Friedmanniomyces endolithicus]